MKSKFLTAICLAFAAAIALACAACGNKPAGNGEEETEKTEAELIAENELFANALSGSEPFSAGGITFRITEVSVVFSPNPNASEKTIKVFLDYPYEVKTVNYRQFTVIDAKGEEHAAVLPDGLDYLGQYREEGKDGRASFIVPQAYSQFVLKAVLPDSDAVYVRFGLNED